MSLTALDSHNIYGVVIDASFPHKVSEDRYVCSLKIIDPSLNSKSSQTSEYAQVVIYAKRFEDLPIVNKVGEIIRLHRATLRMYRNMRQFNVSTQWNGSWAQFAGEEGEVLQPQFYSGKRATFEKHEAVLLQSLRKFTTAYF